MEWSAVDVVCFQLAGTAARVLRAGRAQLCEFVQLDCAANAEAAFAGGSRRAQRSMASRRCRRAVERQLLLLVATQSRRHRWQICSQSPSASCRSPTALNSTSGSLSIGCSPRATLGSRSRRLPELPFSPLS